MPYHRAGGRFCFPFICHDSSQRDFYAGEYDDEVYYEDNERPLAYYGPDNEYYERGYEDEERVYIAPKKKKTAKAARIKPTVKKSAKKKAVTSPGTQSVASVEKKVVTSTDKKTASAAGVSCNKAGEIVSGYGFTSVKPTTCTGQFFAFNATRSGKAYVIKLSSASGELTEVRKVQ